MCEHGGREGGREKGREGGRQGGTRTYLEAIVLDKGVVSEGVQVHVPVLTQGGRKGGREGGREGQGHTSRPLSWRRAL